MTFPIHTYGLFGAVLAAGAIAGPVAIPKFDNELLPALHARSSPMTLGTYSLSTTHETDVLFNIGVSGQSVSGGAAAALEVACVDCRTWGTAVVTTAGVSKDDSIIGDIISFFKNPVDTILSAFDLDVKISFEDCGGHFEFDIFAADKASYSFPIYQSSTPVGMAVSEEVSVGLVLAIDLVFSLSAEIDLEAGFEFSFPDGAYVTVDPLSGDIVDSSFTGGQVDHLPINCTSGSATFQAAIRVRIQAGTTVEVFGTGFDFELGVYADLIEYVATLGTTDECELAITEYVDVNLGAYALAVVEIDYKTFGASPAVISTMLDVALPSLCVTRPVSSTLLAITSTTVLPVTTPIVSPVTTPIVSPVIATSAAPLTSLAIITPAASITTSTVYTTDLITVTSCASTVLHCPASLTSEIIITSTSVLYTTVCPVGQVQPTVAPTTLSTTSPQPVYSATSIASPIQLTPIATPVVSTVYIPTFVSPTYTVPTATVFTAPYPTWNITSATTIQTSSISTITLAPVKITPAPVNSTADIAADVAAEVTSIATTPIYSSSTPTVSAIAAANSTVSTSAQTTSAIAFTGAATRSLGCVMLSLVSACGISLFTLL